MGIGRLRAGQTVYFVWQDWDMYYHEAGAYKILHCRKESL